MNDGTLSTSWCVSAEFYFSLSAACGEGVLGGHDKMLTWVLTAAVTYEIAGCCSGAGKAHYTLGARTGFLCSQGTHPPSHPFTLHPASSLPPTTGPKRRGHAVSETRRDRWCWVQGVVAVLRIRCLLLLLLLLACQ